MPPPQYRKREPFLEPDQPYILISNFYLSWLWGISAYCFSNMVCVVLLGWPELTDTSFYTFSYIICNDRRQVYTIISILISLTLLLLKEKSQTKLRPLFFCFYFLGCIQVNNEDTLSLMSSLPEILQRDCRKHQMFLISTWTFHSSHKQVLRLQSEERWTFWEIIKHRRGALWSGGRNKNRFLKDWEGVWPKRSYIFLKVWR